MTKVKVRFWVERIMIKNRHQESGYLRAPAAMKGRVSFARSSVRVSLIGSVRKGQTATYNFFAYLRLHLGTSSLVLRSRASTPANHPCDPDLQYASLDSVIFTRIYNSFSNLKFEHPPTVTTNHNHASPLSGRSPSVWMLTCQR